MAMSSTKVCMEGVSSPQRYKLYSENTTEAASVKPIGLQSRQFRADRGDRREFQLHLEHLIS